jgi:hypothetical protein
LCMDFLFSFLLTFHLFISCLSLLLLLHPSRSAPTPERPRISPRPYASAHIWAALAALRYVFDWQWYVSSDERWAARAVMAGPSLRVFSFLFILVAIACRLSRLYSVIHFLLCVQLAVDLGHQDFLGMEEESPCRTHGNILALCFFHPPARVFYSIIQNYSF